MNKTISAYVFGLLSGCLVVGLAVAFVASDQHIRIDMADTRVLKIGHGLPQTHPVHAGIERFGELLGEYSDGRMQAQIFPSGQLGDETEMLEQVQRGALEITKTSAAPMGNFVEVAKVFSLPYLFRDEKHYWKVLDGEIGQGFLERLATRDNGDESGFRGLTFFDAGSRNFYSDRPVLKPEDLAGLNIRVMEDPVAMDMVSAMGGSPTPMGWGELYTALKQGVVDGAENNPPSFVASKHYEVSKHFSFDHHSRIPDLLVVSSIFWKSLNAQEQEWLRQAASESSIFQRERWAEATESALKTMRAAGVEIHEVDTQLFAEAARSAAEKNAKGEVGEIYRAIKAVE